MEFALSYPDVRNELLVKQRETRTRGGREEQTGRWRRKTCSSNSASLVDCASAWHMAILTCSKASGLRSIHHLRCRPQKSKCGLTALAGEAWNRQIKLAMHVRSRPSLPRGCWQSAGLG